MTVTEFGNHHAEILLLLHGGGLSWWNFRSAARLLEQHYHVVLPALDGHAGSDAPFTTIEAAAERLIQYVDRHLGGRVTVLGGVSLGGQIALEILARRPDICRYALIESTLAKPMKLTQALIGPSVRMSYGLIRRRWFARLQSEYLGIPEELFEDYYRDTRAIGKEDMVAFMEANCGFRPDAALARTEARVKLLAGTREPGSIRASGSLLRELIPGSQLELLPGLGHGQLSITQPERYAEILRRWTQAETEDL